MTSLGSRFSSFALLIVLLLAPACQVATTGSGGVGAVSCGFPGGSAPSAPEIRFVTPDSGTPARIEIVNVPSRELTGYRQRPMDAEEWEAILRVSVVSPNANDVNDANAKELPPVAGSYTVTGDAIVFTPMFGFDPGRRYRVTFIPAGLTTEVGVPKLDRAPTTVVDRVYPTSEVVPENQLRLYIHFSAPMGLKGGLDYITLLDDRGHPVKDPFLPLDAEFWNADRTRFTVFFDPGRVKRGILPNKEMGRSLTEGKPYTLVVSREWRDGDGLPLKAEFRRVFRVAAPDERPLDEKSWRLAAPRAGTREPFAVTFAEPLDHGLLLRALGVVSSSGAAVPGESAIEPGETRWQFMPREAWKAGGYRLKVLTILEDLAGNRIGRPFEVDQFKQADTSAEPEEISLPFTVTN
jgi:hypothetical protein